MSVVDQKHFSYRIGIDSGGTFTDVCALDERTGEFTVWKVSSTPYDPSAGIVNAAENMSSLLEKRDNATPHITFFGHGTTVGTNALIERRGSSTALITTAGFRDVLEIARQRRPELYNLQTGRPEPLASRDQRFEVTERVQYDGSVLTPLAEEEIYALIPVLSASGVKSVAICFLFSFLNPIHEKRAKEILERELPDIFISISSEIVPEFREYERTSTVVMNSYLGPLMRTYIEKLQGELREMIPSQIMITQSNGGLISADLAASQPVRTVLSGPSAGVMGALEIARRIARGNLITFDMGGTSADVSIVSNFMPRFKPMTDVEGFPIKVPMIDIHAVGAGGGSISYDDHGLIKVGPRSAGANPGPVCYNLGNTEPTVTDANVALGILNQNHLLNGRLPIDSNASRAAIARLGERFGMGWQRAAAGILQVVSANMVNAIRAMTVERGLDPRDFSLFSFGGAGPLHSGYLARELEIKEVVVPAFPGVMCAVGLLTSGRRMDLVRTHYGALTPETFGGLAQHFTELAQQANAWFDKEDVTPPRRNISAAVDLRYGGQAYELTIPVRAGAAEGGYEALLAAFVDTHQERYGYIVHGEGVQMTAVRLEAFETLPFTKPSAGLPARGGSITPFEYREILEVNELKTYRTPVYRKTDLPQEVEFAGPCVVEQMDTTILVLHGQRAVIDRHDNVIITLV
ncbi:hydantoinase/oxoprolinase family protein [Ensifer sp. ENS02]|uniref:hydantoinase/oxoprolinase family protein n=1 Tax=Ensifer sp. ENS02 TaxID=2769290 RepID=UPI001786F236|nr:hydantoinase/oxoprolinase family protein [Ensifer sp. ENS02]MBD9524482.1 hydantoinase/oxoprolinase family protein [Ensifer sp. ENS02]